MQIPLVMTLIGPDRTGLVESVVRVMVGHGGNWLESRMCRLGGEFAGILRIEIPAGRKSSLLAALQKISGLNVVVHTDQKQFRQRQARRRSLKSPAATGRTLSAKSPARPRGRA
jgi:glycine cleavage system regulatory protein